MSSGPSKTNAEVLSLLRPLMPKLEPPRKQYSKTPRNRSEKYLIIRITNDEIITRTKTEITTLKRIHNLEYFGHI